jgi:hypothetical protein
MQTGTSTILHLPDGAGGILCDGSFTDEARNESSVKNPAATSSQKSAILDPGYFDNSNVLSDNEVFCSDCVNIVRSSFPSHHDPNSVHLYKIGQEPYGFSYCGIELEIIYSNSNNIIDPTNISEGNIRPPKPQYLCSNCADGYPGLLLQRGDIV